MEKYKNGLLLIGRVLFSLIFAFGAVEHLTKINAMAGYAASAGVPFPKLAIIVTGLMLLVYTVFTRTEVCYVDSTADKPDVLQQIEHLHLLLHRIRRMEHTEEMNLIRYRDKE